MTMSAFNANPETAGFLKNLFAICDEGWVTLFAVHPDRQNHPNKTRWAPADEAARLAHDADQLHGWNLWVGCATRHKPLDGSRRGSKEDCHELPGLWVDVDIAGLGHATAHRLPDERQAYELIDSFPLPPTVIIHSGHGLQAWWAFSEPQPALSDLLPRWGTTWARLAAEAGFHLDNVFDPPRIMRLPGTTNTKAGCPPVPVVVEHDDWNKRYGIDDIEQFLDAPLEQPPTHKALPYIGPDRPGDAYNARHTTTEQLETLGFIATRKDTDGNQHYKWPNAAGDQSATVWADGHATIWSETAAAQLGVRTQHGYDAFGLYADTQHRGDHSKATKHLAANGYGTPPVRLTDLIPTPTNPTSAPNTDLDVIDQALYDAVHDEYGITGPDAWRLAEQLGGRITHERAVTLARKIIRDDQLARDADLDTIQPINVADLLAAERPPRTPLLGTLLNEGQNATIVARWKVGKSTFVDNAAIAAATGGSFLGTFDVPQPQRVVIFNYELHDDDMADRLATYNIPGSAHQNIQVVNLRGRRLPLTTTRGRDTTVRILQDLGAQLWIVDPFGAAYAAAGGQDENSNAEVRRFLIALDEIKRLSGCHSLLMPVHTGRKTDTEGDEQGRGATVLEDWPDVRMLLTRGQKEQRDYRFLRTEGRAWELDESKLSFDPLTKRLTLPSGDMGVSRRKAKTQQQARIVQEAVAENPGIKRNDLFDVVAELGLTSNGDKAEALDLARRTQLVHFHLGARGAQFHYLGGVHDEAEPCPGGWQNK